jgi:predicted nucleic acid-binding protein
MSAGDRFFVDTNVLLYSADPADAVKQHAARLWIQALWETGSGRLSWQVLHEFYVNAVRKLRVRGPEARNTVEIFAAWRPIDTSLGLIQRAWFWMDEAQVSYWDALIVAAAERAGCVWLLTEDLQAGRKLGAMAVVDPFRNRPWDFGLTMRSASQT